MNKYIKDIYKDVLLSGAEITQEGNKIIIKEELLYPDGFGFETCKIYIIDYEKGRIYLCDEGVVML